MSLDDFIDYKITNSNDESDYQDEFYDEEDRDEYDDDREDSLDYSDF